MGATASFNNYRVIKQDQSAPVLQSIHSLDLSGLKKHKPRDMSAPISEENFKELLRKCLSSFSDYNDHLKEQIDYKNTCTFAIDEVENRFALLVAMRGDPDFRKLLQIRSKNFACPATSNSIIRFVFSLGAQSCRFQLGYGDLPSKTIIQRIHEKGRELNAKGFNHDRIYDLFDLILESVTSSLEPILTPDIQNAWATVIEYIAQIMTLDRFHFDDTARIVGNDLNRTVEDYSEEM